MPVDSSVIFEIFERKLYSAVATHHSSPCVLNTKSTKSTTVNSTAALCSLLLLFITNMYSLSHTSEEESVFPVEMWG